MVRGRPDALLVVALCAAVAAGCTEPLSVDNRPCPCSSGYTCCPATNLCLSDSAACPAFAATVDRTQVRQGDVVLLRVMGADLDGAADVALDDLALGTPAEAARDHFQMTIAIPHGTAPGAKALRFSTHGGLDRYEAPAVVTVTPITVAVGGADTQAGTTDHPFRTFARALSVVGAGDTVAFGPGMFGEKADPYAPIFLPSRITLQGDAHQPTLLTGALVTDGDAVLRNLTLDSAVLINGEGSRTSIDAVTADGANVGVQVSVFAAGATVVLTGGTSITSHLGPAVEWMADNGVLRVIDGTSLSNTEEGNGEAIRLVGDGNVLMIDGASIASSGPDAVTSLRHTDAHIANASFHGILLLRDAQTSAVVSKTTFQISSENKAVGGILFFGSTLEVSDCLFSVTSLFQDGDDAGTVTVRRTTFDGYREPAITLQKGVLDLGTDAEPGANQFQPGEYVVAPPVALRVAAETGTASATMSATTIEGITPPAGSVMGPAQMSLLYEIDQMVPIRFY